MTDYKYVPVEPTRDMERAAESYWNERRFKGLSDDPRTWAGIYQAMLAAAPAVQGEPVAWSGWGCQYPGKMPRLYGDRRIAELNCDWENGDQVLHFTTTPQPAEQQPTTGIVEALRQYRHNDGSGIVFGYDKEAVDRHIERLQQKPTPDVSALVEALEWYSEQVLGCRKITSEGERSRAALDRDGGARAEEALSTYRKGDEQ